MWGQEARHAQSLRCSKTIHNLIRQLSGIPNPIYGREKGAWERAQDKIRVAWWLLHFVWIKKLLKSQHPPPSPYNVTLQNSQLKGMSLGWEGWIFSRGKGKGQYGTGWRGCIRLRKSSSKFISSLDWGCVGGETSPMNTLIMSTLRFELRLHPFLPCYTVWHPTCWTIFSWPHYIWANIKVRP